MLPKEELYMPPMNIRVRDNRQFGRKPMVGISVLKSLEDYRLEPLPPLEDTGDGLDIPSKELSILYCVKRTCITRETCWGPDSRNWLF